MRWGEFYQGFFVTVWCAWLITWLVFSLRVKF
jgi:hypothetical protein